MFDWLSELLEHAWSFFILIIIVIILTALPLTVSAEKTNLEKFNSIDIDLANSRFHTENLLFTKPVNFTFVRLCNCFSDH